LITPTKKGTAALKPPGKRPSFIRQKLAPEDELSSDDDANFSEERINMMPGTANLNGDVVYSEPFRCVIYHYLISLLLTTSGGNTYVNAKIAFIKTIRGHSVRTVEGKSISIPQDRVCWVNKCLRDFIDAYEKGLTMGRDLLITNLGYEVPRLKENKPLHNGVLHVGVYVKSNKAEDTIIRIVRTYTETPKNKDFKKRNDVTIELNFIKYYNPLTEALNDLVKFDKERLHIKE
jgi:hypothetical protein